MLSDVYVCFVTGIKTPPRGWDAGWLLATGWLWVVSIQRDCPDEKIKYIPETITYIFAVQMREVIINQAPYPLADYLGVLESILMSV